MPEFTSTIICLRSEQKRTILMSSAFGGGKIVDLTFVSAIDLGASSLIELSLKSEKIAYGVCSLPFYMSS
jgi:hypothetical protein